MKQIETSTGLTGEIFRFSFPLMLTGILQLAYNAADSVVVGRYAGSVSLAAVGSTTSLVFLLVTMFNGVAVGANYLAANRYGAADEEGVGRAVQCAGVLSVLMGVIAGLVGLALSRPMLRVMHTAEDVLPLAELYLRIYFLGTPALVVYNFGSAILRAVGDSTRPLFFMLISGSVNVALNLLLVVGFRMGVAGVAIATTASQCLSAGMVVCRLCTTQDCCRLNLRKLRLYRQEALLMLKVGFSTGLQGLVFSISNVMIQSQVNTFGSAVMAGNSAASSLEGFIHISQNAFAQAALTFTSQSMGAKKPRRAERVFWACMALSLGLGLVLCGLLLVFRAPLLRFYSKPGEAAQAAVLAAGVVRVMVIGRFQWVGGLMETACNSLRGLGKSMNPTVTTLVGACGLRVIWIYTIFAHTGTIRSLYWSYPVSWTLTLTAHLVFLYRIRRSLQAGAACASQEGELL
ncbi:MAG: MATE family efflux transporter [Oscillibacter sp.]|nr:MATE family efflux transporter [Oscillibacter sp.]MCI9001780.1 MATE family efflux transporter [Oscillibacter sp.]